MVLLRAPEGLRGLDRGHDRVAETLLGALHHAPRGLGLLVGVGEDHRAILIADVRPLAVELRRVVDLEVLLHQVLVVHLGGIEGDLANLDVAGGPAAHLLVGRVVDMAALVSDGGLDHAGKLLERRLDLPEAARAEGRHLGPGLVDGLAAGFHAAPSRVTGRRSCPLLP